MADIQRTTDTPLTPGTITTRAEMMERFGGGPQGGIVPSATTPNVLIYSDPASGEQSGYFDGWLAEEDESGGRIFEYTGHGEEDQTFEGTKGSGNRAILHHVNDKRALLVFKAAGKARDYPHLGVARTSGTKAQRYVGKFQLDPKQPYVVRQAPNRHNVMRRVIVFRMRPVEDLPLNAADVIPPADTTKSIPVPASVTTSAMVEPETNNHTSSARSAVPKTKAERREAKLTAAFQSFLEKQQHDVKRFQIKVKGLSSTLLTDLYDVTAHVLFEAKGTSSRKDIRMAVGQLMDYRRHVHPIDPKLAVLLPDEPHEDLRDLLESVGIALVYRDGDRFIGWPIVD
ncbi:hypothetical protein [Actinomadura rayongensis]|uniref:ScoMcrA-like SRA domain-containing protein n=1 Tax=Actinomadura rayongensis TaxID=1429076 RepID=A0A6I4W512_9ACTN|nr:hypothetical protein [Actinomadura rayongensis]MXQ64541.1 hypothetical protein [Actinomadura rayongensis]